MTPDDDVRDRMDRLAQRQDQLERQQGEATTRVDSLKRDFDSRMDSPRREMDWQFRDREWRIKSLQRSLDTVESLIAFWMPRVAAIAMIIVLVIAVIGSREQRQGGEEPEQRSPSLVDAPRPVPEVTYNRVWPLPGHLSDNITAAWATTAGGPQAQEHAAFGQGRPGEPGPERPGQVRPEPVVGQCQAGGHVG